MEGPDSDHVPGDLESGQEMSRDVSIPGSYESPAPIVIIGDFRSSSHFIKVHLVHIMTQPCSPGGWKKGNEFVVITVKFGGIYVTKC